MALAPKPLFSEHQLMYCEPAFCQLEPVSCLRRRLLSLTRAWPCHSTQLYAEVLSTKKLVSFPRVAPHVFARRKSCIAAVTFVDRQEVDDLEGERSESEGDRSIPAEVGMSQLVGCGSLSARDRRKLRNEKRQDTAKQKAMEKEERELEMSKRKKKKESWDERMDTNRLAVYGVQWWMIQVPRNAEKTVSEAILARVTDKYPDMPFKVLVPCAPAKATLKDGSLSVIQQRLYPGTVLVECKLYKELHDFILATPKARSFMGYKVGPKFREKWMAVPMDGEEVKRMFKAIADAEVEMAEVAVANKEVAKKTKLEERVPPVKPVIEPGVTIQVITGAFVNCTGKVLELNEGGGRIRVNLAIFGRMTPVDLSLGDVIYCSEVSTDAMSVDISRSSDS